MGWGKGGDARLLERGSYVLEIKATRGFNLKIKPTGEQAVTTWGRGVRGSSRELPNMEITCQGGGREERSFNATSTYYFPPFYFLFHFTGTN
jgi:hypothetical protein